LPAVLEIALIEPHAVHDDRELARNRDARLFMPTRLPSLRPHARNDDHLLEIRRWEFAALVERMPHEPVSAFADVARDI
jgi:hypothetical protein